MSSSKKYFVGVDVGTGSVRAAIVDTAGRIHAVSARPIEIWTPRPDHFEQSSENIWDTCCKVIKDVVCGYDKEQIKGIGFDATCSLVALDKQGKPLSISSTGNDDHNIIMWMDHRASEEADHINSFGHPVLRYVGGKVSLEMETPKLLWLKNNMKTQCWDKAGLFFDLPDYLTWRATGSESRSLCSLVCKWTYEIRSGSDHGWNASFFEQIGLADLMLDGCKKIGTDVRAPGSPCGDGLKENVASELGLLPRTPVGTSIIDAHAGGLGLIGCSVDGVPSEFHTRLALICGTSTCHMVVNRTPVFVPGIWGPYYSAMVPEFWLNEGGQSATGKLIDYIIDSHPATVGIRAKICDGMHVQQYLSNLIIEMTASRSLKNMAYLTRNVHVYPDFHGNRSPLADATLRGMISGASLSTGEEDLAILYLATVQALAYGTRHIIETLCCHGHDIRSILICGGLSKNPIFVQTQADVVGKPVVCPNEPESVLLGASILGACAANAFETPNDAVVAMGGCAVTVKPDDAIRGYHANKYKVFLKMVDDQRTYKEMMKDDS